MSVITWDYFGVKVLPAGILNSSVIRRMEMTATLLFSLPEAKGREKWSCFWETKMLSTILLRWWKSLLKRLPQEGKMKEAKKKATAEFRGRVSCHCSVTFTVQPLWSGHLPPRRLSPPRALFGRGPYLPLGSPPPSLLWDLAEPQDRMPKS